MPRSRVSVKSSAEMWTENRPFNATCCLVVLLGISLIVGCGSTGSRPPLGDQALEVELVKSDPPTGFLIRVTNSGQEPVAICPCIGQLHRLIFLELFYNDGNRRVGLPEIDYMDAGARRFYRCLDPGESVSVPVDLRSWEPVWNGRRETFPPFNLLVGPGSYRVRALYIDSGNVTRRGCAGFQGNVASEWVDFESLE